MGIDDMKVSFGQIKRVAEIAVETALGIFLLAILFSSWKTPEAEASPTNGSSASSNEAASHVLETFLPFQGTPVCTITCPSNVTAAAAASCPSSQTAMVNYQAPIVSGTCGTVVCSPPSGVLFPVGTTTVTCTTSAGPSCSFTVTVFSGCLQDDSNPNIVVLFNSQTGEYRFCCNGTVFTGIGIVTVKGCIVTIQANPTDRRVLIKFDGSVNAGTASLQFPPGNTVCTITDRNSRDNRCVCQ